MSLNVIDNPEIIDVIAECIEKGDYAYAHNLSISLAKGNAMANSHELIFLGGVAAYLSGMFEHACRLFNDASRKTSGKVPFYQIMESSSFCRFQNIQPLSKFSTESLIKGNVKRIMNNIKCHIAFENVNSTMKDAVYSNFSQPREAAPNFFAKAGLKGGSAFLQHMFSAHPQICVASMDECDRFWDRTRETAAEVLARQLLRKYGNVQDNLAGNGKTFGIVDHGSQDKACDPYIDNVLSDFCSGAQFIQTVRGPVSHLNRAISIMLHNSEINLTPLQGIGIHDRPDVHRYIRVVKRPIPDYSSIANFALLTGKYYDRGCFYSRKSAGWHPFDVKELTVNVQKTVQDIYKIIGVAPDFFLPSFLTQQTQGATWVSQYVRVHVDFGGQFVNLGVTYSGASQARLSDADRIVLCNIALDPTERDILSIRDADLQVTAQSIDWQLVDPVLRDKLLKSGAIQSFGREILLPILIEYALLRGEVDQDKIAVVSNDIKDDYLKSVKKDVLDFVKAHPRFETLWSDDLAEI